MRYSLNYVTSEMHEIAVQEKRVLIDAGSTKNFCPCRVKLKGNRREISCGDATLTITHFKKRVFTLRPTLAEARAQIL